MIKVKSGTSGMSMYECRIVLNHVLNPTVQDKHSGKTMVESSRLTCGFAGFLDLIDPKPQARLIPLNFLV